MKEVSKIIDSFKDKTCYLYMMGAIAVFFCIQAILTPLLIIIAKNWASKCSETWYSIIIILIALIISCRLIYKQRKYNLFVTHKDIAFSSFALIIYVYYRFDTDLFDFWPLGMWSYTDVLFIPYIILIFIKCKYKLHSPSSSVDNYVLQDLPIEKATDDIMGFNNLVNGLLNDLKSVDLREHSYSIGISASWGLGKSSFLNLFTKRTLDEENIVIRFYPRSSKNIEDIQEDFFETLSIELSKYHTGFKHLIRKYANALQINNEKGWLTCLINAFITLNVIEERETINKEIEKIGRKIFVIIDDLDRLTAGEILEVLKLIDRNGNFCNTVFLTAYDKKYINSVLKNSLGYEAIQDFTDKYFNYEISLPVQSLATLRDYFREYILKYLSVNEEYAVTQKMIIEAWNKESRFIVQKLRSIRHVKRFINIFMSRYPKMKNDINLNDFLLLTLLRYKDMNVYNAIVNGDVVSKSSFLHDGTNEVIYLRENYSELLKPIATWNGCKEILERLFPLKDDNYSISDDYNRIRSASHFDLYFYDYKVGNAYYADLIKLFRTPEDSKAFILIDNMLKNKQELPLEEFLRSRTLNWISNRETLIRLFKLLVYADIKKDFNIESSILWLLQKDTINKAKKSGVITDANAYKDAINEAINQIIKLRPVQLGYLMINAIKSLLDEQVHENPFIFTHQKLAEIAELCQKSYYSKFGTEDWNYIVALNLCKIIGPKEQWLYDYTARVELFSMMKIHPDDFAKNIIVHQVFGNKPTLSLQFIQDFEVKKIFPIDGKAFEDWLILLSDKTTAEVLKHLYEKALNNEYVQVPALHDSYTKADMKAFKEAIDAEDKRIQTDKILSECNTNSAIDLTMLAQNTNIDIEKIKKNLKELVNTGKLSDRYANLKVSIEPFAIGDYVRLKESTYDKLRKKPYYTNNVFKIKSLDSENIELYDIDEKLKIAEVEPIPIDGIADSDLYYDPIIMASIVVPGQPVPIHKTDYSYYMEKMKHCIDIDKKTYYDKIRQNNCQYVHEVQHFLREEAGEDRLRLHHDIRN